jgi:hypothetical protein
MRIRSLEQLRNWIEANDWPERKLLVGAKYPNPPILMEWWLDWFFEAPRKEAIESIDLVVRFTMICEGMPLDKARNRTISNLAYWQDRASYPKRRILVRIGQAAIDWACKEEH